MTEEQEIISSGTPHEVHLPEGSHTAIHKTAVPTAPQVRNTIVNPDEKVELVEIVQGVSKGPEEETRMASGASAADEPPRIHNEESDHLADHMVHDDAEAPPAQAHAPTLAPPLDQVMSELPSLELGTSQATADLVLAPAAAEAMDLPTPPQIGRAHV